MVSYSYWIAFAWGLAATLSFAGWGAAIARFAGIRDEDRDWALCACWGMAIITVLGGALALFSLASGPILMGLAVAGWYLAAIWLRTNVAGARKWEWGAALVFTLTLIIFYAPSVASRDVEPYDDYLAYFTFARRFLDTGTLIEPFSFRRLLSYGGQSLLHAFTISAGSEKGMHLLDSGIAMLILGGLIYRWLRSATTALWAALGSIAILMVPLSRNNVASQATGLILWIALYRTLRLKTRGRNDADQHRHKYPIILAALLLAALCAFRSTYTLAVAILCLGLLVSSLGRARAFSLSGWWKLIAAVSAAVAPWALLSYRSSGTFIYPLFEGYQRAGLGSTFQTTWMIKLHALLHFFTNPNVLFLLVPLILAVILTRGPHVPFCVAAVVLACAIPWGTPLTEDSLIYRYAQPLAWGSLLVAAAPLIRARKNVAIVLVALMSPVWAAYAFITVNRSVASVRSLPTQIADESPAFPAEQVSNYRQLDAALPHGSGVFAIVPLPSLLDYRTHRVFNADFIGRASLPPGMPFFEGPTALKDYLLAAGIDTIAYNDFDRPSIKTGYWRPWWRDRMSSLKPDFAPVVPYVLDLMKNVDELVASEGTTFRTGDLRVIHLSHGGGPLPDGEPFETSAHVPQK